MHYLFFIIIYAFTSYALYRMAKTLSAPRPWFAILPFAREWLLVQMVGKSWKWYVALLLPVVNIGASWIVWGDLARKFGRSVWLGRAMVIPMVNLPLLAALAFDLSWNDVGALLTKIIRKFRRKKVSR